MTKFDLNQAKKGKKVTTKNGKEVKILHFTRGNDKFPIVAIIENKQVVCYTEEGKFFDNKDSKNDLYLV